MLEKKRGEEVGVSRFHFSMVVGLPVVDDCTGVAWTYPIIKVTSPVVNYYLITRSNNIGSGEYIKCGCSTHGHVLIEDTNGLVDLGFPARKFRYTPLH